MTLQRGGRWLRGRPGAGCAGAAAALPGGGSAARPVGLTAGSEAGSGPSLRGQRALAPLLLAPARLVPGVGQSARCSETTGAAAAR